MALHRSRCVSAARRRCISGLGREDRFAERHRLFAATLDSERGGRRARRTRLADVAQTVGAISRCPHSPPTPESPQAENFPMSARCPPPLPGAARAWRAAPLMRASAALQRCRRRRCAPALWPWALGAVRRRPSAAHGGGTVAAQRGCSGPTGRVCRAGRAARAVAITIDDGPDPEVTPRVLALLDAAPGAGDLLLHRRARRALPAARARDRGARPRPRESQPAAPQCASRCWARTALDRRGRRAQQSDPRCHR